MTRWIAVGAVVGLASLGGGPPALGANMTVTAKSSNVFDPASVTVVQGDTVTWMNMGGGLHDVHFDDNSFMQPPQPSTADWTVMRRFDQLGTYRYYCDVHGGAGGIGMSGTVVVQQAPPGGGGGGGGGGGPPPADMAPVSLLISSASQRVPKLFVRASMNEAGTLTATGTVSVPGAAKVYRFKPVSKAVAANQSVRLRLRLAKRPLLAVKRALRHGKRLRARIALTARDMTGHTTVRRQTIRLKR